MIGAQLSQSVDRAKGVRKRTRGERVGHAQHAAALQASQRPMAETPPNGDEPCAPLRRMPQGPELYAAIVESAADAIVSLSSCDVILYWNPAAQELYGYPYSSHGPMNTVERESRTKPNFMPDVAFDPAEVDSEHTEF